MERVEPDDPRRCQGVIPSQGQCPIKAEDGSDFCIVHGGPGARAAAKNKRQKQYLLHRWNKRKDDFSDHSELKNLHEEIGILRMLIEQRLNGCLTELDLMAAAGPLADLIMKVEKLISSSTRMEEKLGLMLDQQQAMQLIDEIINIISDHVDESTLAEIADQIVERMP